MIKYKAFSASISQLATFGVPNTNVKHINRFRAKITLVGLQSQQSNILMKKNSLCKEICIFKMNMHNILIILDNSLWRYDP